MSVVVQLSGHAGQGKSYSIKSLTEKYKSNEIFYINADNKPLSWAGWREFFNKENRNYIVDSDPNQILNHLIGISNNRPDVKVIIVDTINTIMSDKEMNDRRKPGFDKWADLAGVIYDLYSGAAALRDDLIVVFTAHIEEYQVDTETHWRTKTVGAKLTKLNLNSKLSYNLYTQVSEENGKRIYKFSTQTNGKNEARSVAGVLPLMMDNDLAEVVRLIREKDLLLKD